MCIGLHPDGVIRGGPPYAPLRARWTVFLQARSPSSSPSPSEPLPAPEGPSSPKAIRYGRVSPMAVDLIFNLLDIIVVVSVVDVGDVGVVITT